MTCISIITIVLSTVSVFSILPVALSISAIMLLHFVIKRLDALSPGNWAIVCVGVDVNILSNPEPTHISNRIMAKLTLVSPSLSFCR